MAAMVSVTGLNHRYGKGPTALTVLSGLEMELEPGGYAAVSGVSGAGKSTLLAILGGLEPVQQGRVLVAGVNLSCLGGCELARFRRERIGFVFQDFGLLTMLSARENVEIALALARVPRCARRKHADTLLAEVGLAIATRWSSPPLSRAGRWVARSARPTSASRLSACLRRSQRGTLARARATSTFSRAESTVSSPKS